MRTSNKTRQGAMGAQKNAQLVEALNAEAATQGLENDTDEELRLPTPLPGALKSDLAALYLSLSLPTVRRLVKAGLLRPNRNTRHLLFSIRELERFLDEGRIE